MPLWVGQGRRGQASWPEGCTLHHRDSEREVSRLREGKEVNNGISQGSEFQSKLSESAENRATGGCSGEGVGGHKEAQKVWRVPLKERVPTSTYSTSALPPKLFALAESSPRKARKELHEYCPVLRKP